MEKFKNTTIENETKKYLTELEVRELIASILANWQGITRFRTVETDIFTLADFTNATHDHSGATGGGQLTDTALSSPVTVPKGGTGANSLTGIIKGNGAGAMTTITPLSGTKVYYVSDTSGGAVTRKLTFTDGILTSET